MAVIYLVRFWMHRVWKWFTAEVSVCYRPSAESVIHLPS